MKKEKKNKNYFSLARINFLLLILFSLLNNMDYFSTYLSIFGGGVEINPIVRFMLDSPLLFFVWKILILPMVVWYIGYESESRKIMWCLVGVDLVYLWFVIGNLRVIF